MSEWISVKYKLPALGQWYVALSVTWERDFYGDNELVRIVHPVRAMVNKPLPSDATHWFPLPEPPRAGE